MRIAQILTSNASEYDRKSQKVDRTALASRHEVIETTFEGAIEARASLIHVYGAAGYSVPRSLAIPYIASGPPHTSRLRWSAPPQPVVITSPLANLPEAVDDSFFTAPAKPRVEEGVLQIGSFGRHRPGVLQAIEQTMARIHRFRSDIDWLLFDEPPSADDLALVDAWVDPATSEGDYDGFVAEAVVSEKVAVASRTLINFHRLEKGRTGFLVPPRDPNELAHAILSALFKSEVALLKIEGARQTVGKFRPRQRLRLLEAMYETVIP